MQRVPISTILIVIGMTVVWVMFGSLLLDAARSHDFLNIYTGSSLAREGRFADLHDPALQFERGASHLSLTTNPGPLRAPVVLCRDSGALSLLPYNTAFVVWVAIQVTLLIGCWI